MPDSDLFDIEDLSLVLQRRAALEDSSYAPPADEDLTLRIAVERLFDEEDEREPESPSGDSDAEASEPTIRIVDTLTREEQQLFRFSRGCYLRYRLAILGICAAAEELYEQVRSRLVRANDLLVAPHNLWARYDVGIFGGHPRVGGTRRADAEVLADRLARFRPNYLALVNVGQVKRRFADHTAQELALLSHRVNSGATAGGQRPYDLVFVCDTPISTAVFARYVRSCQLMNTFPASMQFAPDEAALLVEHVRVQLSRHTQKYLRPL